MGRARGPWRHRRAARPADRAAGSPDHGVRPARSAHHALGVSAHPPAPGDGGAQGLFRRGVAGVAATGVVCRGRGDRGRAQRRHAAAGAAGRRDASARAPPGHHRATDLHGHWDGPLAGPGGRVGRRPAGRHRGGRHRPGPGRERGPRQCHPGHCHPGRCHAGQCHPRHAAADGEQGSAWAHRTEKIYVVKPPDGRFHESLWEIAENHLGDGRRYREIFELNAGRPQPDGSVLTIASLIRPGWVLRMPHYAYGPGIEEAKASPPARHSRPPAAHPPAAHPPAPPKHAQAPPVPPASSSPAAQAPAPPSPAVPAAPDSAAPARRPAQDHTAPARAARSPGFPVELAAAGLLAACVLAALERRRRRQARRRPPGRRVVTAPPDAAQAEVALRLGEDGTSARMLDTGLRYLGRELRQQGRTPPTVFAAHIGEDNLDLWVAPPGHDAPAPWYAVGDGEVWRLPLADVPGLDPGQAGHGPALYPGLVTIGTDATGRVLVDLEAARGLIAVTGPGDLVAEALSAIAAELATSLWADAMQLTLVGTGVGLEVLEPDRVHLVSSVAEALPLAEAHAAGVTNALAASGARSVLAGRAEGLVPEAWAPHYLVTLIPPTAAEAQRLSALAAAGYPAAGYLVAGEVPGAAWTWEVTADGRLRAAELGL